MLLLVLSRPFASVFIGPYVFLLVFMVLIGPYSFFRFLSGPYAFFRFLMGLNGSL